MLRSNWPRRLLFAGLAVLGLYLVHGMIVRKMLYPAPPVRVGEPPAPLEEIRLEATGGPPVVGWAHTAPTAAGDVPPAVLFLHGNGENLETMRFAGLYDELLALGVSFLALDYPGYGKSGGRASEPALVAAALAGHDWLGERHPGARRAIVGWSLGAGVAVQAAAKRSGEVAGLALLSAWSTLPEVAGDFFPKWLVGFALADRYDSIGAAARIDAPVLMIHGVEDRIIRIEHGRRLHRAFGERARWLELPRTGHNDLLGRSAVWRELEGFLTRIGEDGR